MNGVRLLVLFAAALLLDAASVAGQSANPLPTDLPRDFGWQTNQGVLEYIVQISPEQAVFMQQNGEEVLSDTRSLLVHRLLKGESEFPKEQRRQLLDILITYFQLHIPNFRPLKSVDVLHDLLD